MGLLDFLTGKGKAAPGPAGATDTTAAPAEELKKEIIKHGLDASKIDIKVEGRKVTLSGSAPTTADVEKIVLAVGNTRGVAQVENKIVAANAHVESKFYTVQQGDTLWKIAEMEYGPGKEPQIRRDLRGEQAVAEGPGQNLPRPEAAYSGARPGSRSLRRHRVEAAARNRQGRAKESRRGRLEVPDDLNATRRYSARENSARFFTLLNFWTGRKSYG